MSLALRAAPEVLQSSLTPSLLHLILLPTEACNFRCTYCYEDFRLGRMEPVVEQQEYALGTVCAAIPITAGTTAGTLAISLPSHQAARLLPLAHQLQTEIGKLLGTLAISISI